MSRFWEDKPLAAMSDAEWESLCDGCGKCCLQKLQDDDTDELFYTNVACRYLDSDNCRCRDYKNRKKNVPECLVLRDENPEVYQWLPPTCAYRLIAQKRPLPIWHPLLQQGSANMMFSDGHSVRGKVYSEEHIHPDDLQEYIVHWVDHEANNHV